ncbi:AMP-binding protein [Propioniciclava flava]
MTYPGRQATPATHAVRAARDFLLAHPHDYDAAVAGFRWPHPESFNFALEWFDVVAAEHPDRPAVTIAEPGHEAASWTYGELSQRSDQVASWLRDLGVRPGDLMVVMLNNTIDLWEILLGLLKVGAVAIPTSTLLSETDLAWRIDTVSAGWAIAPTALAERFALVRPETTVIGVGHDVPHRLDRLVGAPCRLRHVRAGRGDPRRGDLAAVLHLRDHRSPQARSSYAGELPDRASLHDVLVGRAPW